MHIDLLVRKEEKRERRFLRLYRKVMFRLLLRAGIAQWVVCWARCPAWCSIMGLMLLWASGRGDFSLRVSMSSDSIPQKLLWMRVMTVHMHSIAWTASLAKWLRHPLRERKIPGSNPACNGIFPGSSHTSDLKIGSPVATLPGAWHYRVSAGTGQPDVSIL